MRARLILTALLAPLLAMSPLAGVADDASHEARRSSGTYQFAKARVGCPVIILLPSARGRAQPAAASSDYPRIKPDRRPLAPQSRWTPIPRSPEP